MRHVIAALVIPAALVATPMAANAYATMTARTITLTATDNGRHVRVHRGDTVQVLLRADPRANPDPTTWWRAIDESGPALRALPQTAISIRGTTRGRYRAAARGEATLSSSRPVCPRHGTGPTCHSMQGWNVTVDVR